MSDVFVSYKAEDRRRVQPLVQALQADGLSVWWDEHIGAGDAWRETIEQQLDNASCVVVVWSKRSVGVDGKFVREEASRAQRRGVYVPILIDPVDPPLGFGESQATSLRGWHNNRSDPHYQALLAAVRRNVSGDSEVHSQPSVSPMFNRRAMIAGGATVAAVAVAGGGWALFRPSSAGAMLEGIAVLPFANLSGDPAKAYFSDGIAEEIRGALAHISGLRVVGRTSSEAVRNDDAKTAAKKLGVGNILTGSVRQTPSTIRVSAELIDGRNGTDRWSEGYDRPPGDAIKIQTDIAENVAGALNTTLGPGAKALIGVGGTTNPAAQDDYLKARARYEMDQDEGAGPALSLVDSALALDPGFARAHSLKARIMAWMAASAPDLEKAAAVARRAVALAPNLAAGHTALARILLDQLNVSSAGAEYEKAHSIPDGDVDNLVLYSVYLSTIGNTNLAIDVAEQAVSQDPLSALAYAGEGFALFRGRRYDEAVVAYRKMLALAPKRSADRFFLVQVLMLSGKYAEAFAEIRRPPVDFDPILEALLFGRQGNRAASDAALLRAQKQYGDAASYWYAQVFVDRHDHDRAFAMLDRAWAIRDTDLTDLKTDPFMDPIRSDPRFAILLKRMNFPS